MTRTASQQEWAAFAASLGLDTDDRNWQPWERAIAADRLLATGPPPASPILGGAPTERQVAYWTALAGTLGIGWSLSFRTSAVLATAIEEMRAELAALRARDLRYGPSQPLDVSVAANSHDYEPSDRPVDPCQACGHDYHHPYHA